MKKYICIGLLYMQSALIFTMQTDQELLLVHQKSVIEITKKRRTPSRAPIGRKKSEPIEVTGSGEFDIEEGKTIIDLLKKSNDSLSRSPSWSDYSS